MSRVKAFLWKGDLLGSSQSACSVWLAGLPSIIYNGQSRNTRRRRVKLSDASLVLTKLIQKIPG